MRPATSAGRAAFSTAAAADLGAGSKAVPRTVTTLVGVVIVTVESPLPA